MSRHGTAPALRAATCGAGLICLLLSAPRAAQAQRCPPPPGGSPALSAIDADARLRFITSRLQHAARRARLWTWLWGSTYATLTTVNFVLAPLTIDPGDPGRNVEFYVSGASSALGVATLLIAPPRELRDQRRLEALLSRSAGTPQTESARCAVLAEAERLLLRDAADQARGKSMLIRAGSMVFNVGVGALLGFGFNRWNSAAINTMAGIAIAETMVATRPADLVGDLRSYQAGQLAPTPAAVGPQWALVPVSAGAPGLQLVVGF